MGLVVKEAKAICGVQLWQYWKGSTAFTNFMETIGLKEKQYKNAVKKNMSNTNSEQKALWNHFIYNLRQLP